MFTEHERRRFLIVAAGAAGAGALLAGCASTAARPSNTPRQADAEEEEEISPVEDLMREHGVLRRVILVYSEISRRIQHNESYAPEVVASAANLIRRFVEDYHEKLEEDFVFPRFEKAQKHVELVGILRSQHQAGRRLTDAILATAAAQATSDRASLVASIGAFIRMYEPHAAREDTVLFPDFRAVVGEDEYAKLGEIFEDKEHKLFGPKGFESVVAEVAQLEKALGIYDLAQFTAA